MEVKTVFVVAGPTASGKTAVAVQLAQKLGTAVISADSRQCYNEMTIGTAKPSPEELDAVQHYFVNAFPVNRSLTAADYEELSLGYLQEIFSTKDTAVVCGGTGLYIRALCEGLDEMPDVSDDVARDVHEKYEMLGRNWLQESLRGEDPQFYAQGEIRNPARMLRALIFKRSTGYSILNFRTGSKKDRPFRVVKAGLELPREVLYERINDRVDTMMAQGLLEEVKTLYPQRQLKNLQTVGYVELFDYLDNKMSLPEAVEKIKQNTRHYAKRQMTWFKKDKEIHWFPADDPGIVDKILSLA